MAEHTRDINLYENQGSLIQVGSTQVLSFTNFNTPTQTAVSFVDTGVVQGAWEAGEAALIDGNPASIEGTGLSYAGVKVTLLGITLADIKLSSPVQTALISENGGQFLHFYNADGSEADPAAMLNGLASQLVAALTGVFSPLLQPLVNAILLDPLSYVENNALLTMNLSSGGEIPFVPCFVKGTRIVTRNGEIPVEDLRVGDHVMTIDSGFRPIRWIGKRYLSATHLNAAPHLRPIRFDIGSLGNGLPLRPLFLSPQHRCLVRSKITQRVTGEREVLVAARHMLDLDGVEEVTDPGPVTYYHLLLDRHEILISDGAMTESFFLGPMAISGLSAMDRMEVLSLFPNLSAQFGEESMQPARKFLSGHIARTIVGRAVKNAQDMVQHRTYRHATPDEPGFGPAFHADQQPELERAM